MKRIIALAVVLVSAVASTSFAGDKQAAQELNLGQGEFRYRHRPDKLIVPAQIKQTWQHVHGISLSPNNEIYVTYSTEGTHNTQTKGLIKFNANGVYQGTVGDNTIARGTPHGLDGQVEQGEFFLYHSNNAGKVYKTDTQGNTQWKFTFPDQLPNYQLRFLYSLQTSIESGLYELLSQNYMLFPLRYMPCNVAFHPSGKSFYMADCYGSSFIHKFSTQDGSYQQLSFGGKGTALGEFDTPHGLIFDTRKQQLLVADRSNSRLQYVDLNGQAIAQITDPAIAQPCDFDLMGDYLLVPDLAGHLTVLDKDNNVVSKIDVAQQLAVQGVVYPHDAIFLPNHDIIVGTWNPGTLTYWERIK